MPSLPYIPTLRSDVCMYLFSTAASAFTGIDFHLAHLLPTTSARRSLPLSTSRLRTAPALRLLRAAKTHGLRRAHPAVAALALPSVVVSLAVVIIVVLVVVAVGCRQHERLPLVIRGAHGAAHTGARRGAHPALALGALPREAALDDRWDGHFFFRCVVVFGRRGREKRVSRVGVVGRNV